MTRMILSESRYDSQINLKRLGTQSIRWDGSELSLSASDHAAADDHDDPLSLTAHWKLATFTVID